MTGWGERGQGEAWPVSPVFSKLTRAGQTISFAYDDLNRQTSKTGAAVDDVTTTYDLVGWALTVTSAGGRSFSHAYDTVGRLISVTDQGSRVVSYQYDPAGNRTRLTHPDGDFVDYAYDALNRMETVTENGATLLASFGYDPLSRTTSLAYGNGAGISFDYEPDSDLKEIVHTFASGGWALTGGGTGIEYGFAYSKAHQLRSQSANAPDMLFRPQGTQAIAYAVNALNQYTTVTTDSVPATISHDQNGNLTGDGSNTFTYDAENRLMSAAMGGGANVAYAYGPMGRRAAKTVDGVTTEYLYDGDHAIAELDGSGAVLRRYVHGPGTDRPIAMVEGGPGSYAHSYYHADRLGSVVALTGDSGAPVAHYVYNAYGAPYLVDPGTGAQTQVAAGQPYLFTGRRFDFETGLYYYRARYYSASLGRFLQTDPVGYEDQMNLYAYVGNDPVNGTDPGGECKTNRDNKVVEGCHIDFDKSISKENKEAFMKQLYLIGVAIEDASYDPDGFKESWEDIGKIKVNDVFRIRDRKSIQGTYKRGKVDKVERGIINFYRGMVTAVILAGRGDDNARQEFNVAVLDEIGHGTSGGRADKARLEILAQNVRPGDSVGLERLGKARLTVEQNNERRAYDFGRASGLIRRDWKPFCRSGYGTQPCRPQTFP